MSNYTFIQKKLHQFIRKYYVNELIKGVLLFFSIGLLYFMFTLLVEHFFWLKPTARTILFLLFISVEVALVVFYILLPIFKLWGFQKGINDIEASKIIGNHFPEVKDKLLNMIQLRNNKCDSELIEASIEQKSSELKLIPFKRAVDFSTNKKYIKYALIPVVIWLFVYVSGNTTIFNESFSRVVHYQQQYQPPAPFSFQVLNASFDVIEGQPFTLEVQTVGDVIPSDAKIYFNNENYYLENLGFGKFQHTFSSINQSFFFYIEANGVVSNAYKINAIATPVITNLTMVLNYPAYTGKTNEVIKNTGNAIVPQGTKIDWQINTHQTNQVSFITKDAVINFNKSTNDYFSFSKRIFKTEHYKINTSNSQLKNHESLAFSVEVIPDELPTILVKSDIDSITRGPVQFVGQLSDDYGVEKLQLVYYDKNHPKSHKTHQINIVKSLFTDFYYVFPEEIQLDEGVEYEFYFEVFDNDRINGSKKSKSQKFSYYTKTEKEENIALLKEQKATINSISKSLEKSKRENSELKKFQNELQQKADINWNDTKKLEEFVKRQNQYQEMFENQTEQLQENLKDKKVGEDLVEKKQALQKRIEETKQLAKQEKLLDELNKLTEKIEKEDLVDKLKDIAKKNKRNEQSLERILELTKRFYVEQKANQISKKLKDLGKEEEQLSNETEALNSPEKQQEINKQFEGIRKEFEELNEMNDDLKRPMDIPNDEDKLNEISEDLEKALGELKQNNNSNAKKSQKKASKNMQKLGKSMESSMMQMEGEMIDENIEDLRKIVENLIEFSFHQETLMDRFSGSDLNNATFPESIKEQYILKEYFEHIDDSLYVLSLRLVTMGVSIQKEVSNVHYSMDSSLENFSDNRFEQGISNQHFALTSVNILANQLSDLLESLMNASASMGKGKGKGSKPGFVLPDIIKKQGELSDQMKKGSEKGNKPGDNNPGENGIKLGESSEGMGEEMNGELYEIYKEQAKLRQALEEMLGDKKGGSKGGSDDVLKQMQDLEKEMLEQGFTKNIADKMLQLQYELLKLEDAELKQGEEKERKSETNIQTFEQRAIQKLKLQNQYFNYNEILNRQSLPLRTIYKKKVQEYFKTVQ
ncbi:protein of unknown function [Lutibacter agarilyticus]|uniref:Uncharacterized protein n=1 Tax=Lutibacter agarilyticus TaxID=1109740 RepID=A0A238W3A2_9FLAO|nr:DUF4175 family protein [Lutibacter agarilyticus]SNR40887.1 protein of unknown function [Lutibacter agarilyticus]